MYDKLTGGEFLRFAAALYGMQGPVVERRIDELLELFELTAWKHELTESYSHGMRQKLIIAGALVHRPEVIVVDEPMVGLDPKSARLLKELFRQFVEPRRHGADEHAHARDRRGDVRPDRHRATAARSPRRERWPSCGSRPPPGSSSLEDLFLKLTGGHAGAPLDAVLDA